VNETKAVRYLFEQVAPHYDNFNDLFSFGLHRVWKRQALALVKPKPGERWLDLCCGTGDVALVLANYLRPGGEVLAVDSAAAPLAIARQRSARMPWLQINWLQADVLNLPSFDTGFDGAVIAYGLRNLADPGKGLKVLKRLLHPSGRGVVLDFNPSEGFAGIVRQWALAGVVVPVARQVGLGEQYSYLEESIARFPDGIEQEKLAIEAGFSGAKHRSLAGGLMGALMLQC